METANFEKIPLKNGTIICVDKKHNTHERLAKELAFQ